jgi:hypothetical protein
MGPQEYALTMQDKQNYLQVFAQGVRSRETVKAITLKVFHTACEKHLSKVLIDVRDLTGEFGFLDIYYLVTDVLNDLGGKGVNQVAVIDIRRSPRPGWFLETVAQHRGYNFRVFPEEESARKWLCV